MPEPAPARIPPTVIAAGGETITINLRDGTTAAVKVRLLEMEHFLDFVSRLEDENLLAEFVCAQSPGWAKLVTVESILEIAEKAQALNLPAARRWMQRRADLKTTLEPIRKQIDANPSTTSASSAPGSA